MSNIDKQALNQEKIEWLNKLADMEYCKSNPGHWLMSLKDTNMLAKLALRSVALLDELEAKDKVWSAQDNHINQQADRIESLEKKNGDLGRALEAAEKRIAELEAKLDSADKLQDSAFRHGLQHGFSYGQTDDQAGFEKAIQAYGQQ
ncbi:TPA: hypothetical protein MDS10_003017 [Escherichia coli]|nr:hypothetical protein [Escherichia coli]